MAFKMKMKGFYKNFDFGSKKPENKRDYTAKEEMDFSPHNISARRTEGTIKQQEKRLKARQGGFEKGWDGAEKKPNINLMAGSKAANLNLMANTGSGKKYKKNK